MGCISERTDLFLYSPQEREQKAEEERIRMENILSGNPLINLAGQQQQQQQQQMSQSQNSFRVKRRYHTKTPIHTCCIWRNCCIHFQQTINTVSLFQGGMMMSCSRIAPKEWTKLERRNVLSMTHCALSSTRNLWRNM